MNCINFYSNERTQVHNESCYASRQALLLIQFISLESRSDLFTIRFDSIYVFPFDSCLKFQKREIFHRIVFHSSRFTGLITRCSSHVEDHTLFVGSKTPADESRHFPHSKIVSTLVYF